MKSITRNNEGIFGVEFECDIPVRPVGTAGTTTWSFFQFAKHAAYFVVAHLDAVGFHRVTKRITRRIFCSHLGKNLTTVLKVSFGRLVIARLTALGRFRWISRFASKKLDEVGSPVSQLFHALFSLARWKRVLRELEQSVEEFDHLVISVR